jgi:hypothetical protein
VIFTRLLTGILFGVTVVSDLPVGALVAAIQLAISCPTLAVHGAPSKQHIRIL